jgi:anti-anti-sigma factor
MNLGKALGSLRFYEDLPDAFVEPLKRLIVPARSSFYVIASGGNGIPMADYQYISYKNVDGVAVVNFLETVSMFDGDKVRDVGNELMDLIEAKKYTKLLLNMTNARFVSSAMLAHLVKLHRKVQEVKGKIRLCCLRPVIMDAFKVSNFDKIFEIFADEAAALKKF